MRNSKTSNWRLHLIFVHFGCWRSHEVDSFRIYSPYKKSNFSLHEPIETLLPNAFDCFYLSLFIIPEFISNQITRSISAHEQYVVGPWLKTFPQKVRRL
jgi:hypothetical protein